MPLDAIAAPLDHEQDQEGEKKKNRHSSEKGLWQRSGAELSRPNHKHNRGLLHAAPPTRVKKTIESEKTSAGDSQWVANNNDLPLAESSGKFQKKGGKKKSLREGGKMT